MDKPVPLEEHAGLKKKYKILIIAGSVILAVLIIGIIIFTFTKLKVPLYQDFYKEKYETCISERSEWYNEIMAEKTGDVKYCNKLEGLSKDYCIIITTKNIAGCNNPEFSENDQTSCRRTITKDSTLCDQENYECIARTTRDMRPCLNIENEKDKQECIALAKQDADYFLNDQVKTECSDKAYILTMYQFQDKKICKNVVNPERREDCLKAFT